ncbi:universal stress protein [Guptibacillus hwajinpoensis]|uniref:Nucleotide-binding universal stress UspA family protein n=1 Tax=Guptibacillus hwajinpoensis TaxID=208199 RepID=A0ABU0K2I0_9BACL|nr:universal stress protein [Alkalihalobacillus hemicentroti]MDQ0483558.1 nucleotide-binding universal stress UspA family protein [Alkalihalobacillus hemicentroti]
MRKYTNVLVAYDGSDLSMKALNEAITMAKENPALQIDVVTALNPTAQISSAVVYASILNELRKEAVDLLKVVSDELHEQLPNHVLRTMVLEGNPGNEIVKYADDHDRDLIIMGSRGLNGLREWFLGSVSHAVLQRSHCPVLIIK